MHSKVNKMNVENLATVMGINLLKPQIEDPITVMKGKNGCRSVLSYDLEIMWMCLIFWSKADNHMMCVSVLAVKTVHLESTLNPNYV